MNPVALQTSPDVTIGDLAAAAPAVIPVLERLGLDYCCGGGRPLGQAVADRGLEWPAVKAQIDAALAAPPLPGAPRAWGDAPLADLMAHIQQHYHARLREDLPSLTTMGEKVAHAHGDRHPEVRDVAAVFADLRQELESQMMKEEHIHLENNVLFPRAQSLESQVLRQA
jgi:regulator of cell morphogenesis and NO signaling